MRRLPGSFDPNVCRALGSSFLAAFPENALEQLLADAFVFRAPAASVFMRASEASDTALIVSGMARVFLAAADGRQVTVRYAERGAAVGVSALVGERNATNAQAVTVCTLLRLNVDTLHGLEQTDGRVALAVAQEVTRRYHDMLDEVAVNAFGSVRQRVARHLIDLAAEAQQGRPLIARVTHQDLADAIGSVREVVGRAVRQLASDGLVESGAHGIALRDAIGLHAVAQARSASGERPKSLWVGLKSQAAPT